MGSLARRWLLLDRNAITNLDTVLKSRDITLATKVCIVKAMVLPVVKYGCKSWTIKKAEHQRVDAFELWDWRRLLAGHCKIKPVNLKGNQSWVLIERTDAEAEAPILWPPDVKSWLIGKGLDAGKYWGQNEKKASENEMAGWHHQCNEHELGQSLGDSEGQGGLVCCRPWDHKESDMTGQPNNNSQGYRLLWLIRQ